MHSILIPHRDRQQHLGLCLWSLGRCTHFLDFLHKRIDDFEVLVLDNGSQDLPAVMRAAVSAELDGRVSVRVDKDAMPVFNKSRLYNLGIEAAAGDVLTFLDADAIVGRRFLEGAAVLADPALTRCCYRVRYLSLADAAPLRLLEKAQSRDSGLDALFGRYNAQQDGYDVFQLGYEAYGVHDRSVPNGEPWGNSQFSIRRDALGDLRFDEGFWGHGMEDLDLLMRIEAHCGDRYRGHIWTDGEHALFHQVHASNAWRSSEYTFPNAERYRAKRKELLGR
jgi:glycosyltransferase involved in cell wall biosynthesis